MGGPLSPETPIPAMLTRYHLSQLDRTTQIYIELWVLPFLLNLGQLGSLEIPVTINYLYRWISIVDNKNSPADNKTSPVQPADLGTFVPKTKDVANTTDIFFFLFSSFISPLFTSSFKTSSSTSRLYFPLNILFYL
jgi:hypothetical protein